MSTEIVTALIAVLGAVVSLASLVLTYWFTKRREHEAELRKEKLEHSKDFVASFSGIMSGESTPEGQRAFARACNKLNLIAPQTVIRALQDFQQEIRVSNENKSIEKHDKLISRLLYEMRKDLKIKPKDENTDLVFGLWAAGVPSEKS